MTERDKNIFGLLVDEVTEVLRIPQSDIKAAPEIITKVNREYVSGVITLNDRLIILLDLYKVLSSEELDKLTEFYQKSRLSPKKEKTKSKRVKVSAMAEEQIERNTEVPQPI
jgi:hypothetical protein